MYCTTRFSYHMQLFDCANTSKILLDFPQIFYSREMMDSLIILGLKNFSE